MRRHRLGWFAALALLFGASQSHAQPEPPPLAAPVTAPRLIEEIPPTYPTGATRDAVVIVELVVGEDGAPYDLRVFEGSEPFASAAIASVERARFEPAQRAGRPIRARIRLRIAFTAPRAAREEPTPIVTTGVAPVETSARPEAPTEEVVVTGRRDDPETPTEHRIGQAEMRVVPGAFGDPFRAIDILPSLVPIVSGLPYYYIRGAPPSAVGYYVDEVRVPYLFHFGFGPGVIQPALLDEVALHPATYPARYGRFAGGIVSGTTREPPTELYGEGRIRLFDAGAYVEAPFAEGRATAGVGGRYSYTAGLLSLFVPELTIDYRDYNARVSYALNDRWRLSAVALGAFDFAAQTEGGREQVLFGSEFHRLDLRADRRGDDGSTSRIAATVGIDRTRLEDARFAQDLVFGVRGRHAWPFSRAVNAEVGFDAMFDFYAGDLPNPYVVSRNDYAQAVALFAPRTETATGAWASSTFRPLRGWEITTTMRADLFTSAGKLAVGPSPRATVRVPLVPKVSFLAALGIAPQPPAFAIPVPAIGYRGLPGGLSYAYQKSAGAEARLPWGFTLTSVGFHHTYLNLRSFAQGADNIQLDRPQLEPGSPTQAFGVEVLLKRKLSERYSAYSSATISRAQVGSTRIDPAGVSRFDRTFVAQVGGVADLGRHWTASSRFLTYGGWPGDQTGAARLPPFFRFDLRIEKRWIWREHRYIAFVMEGLNVTGSKEVLSRSCNAQGECRSQEIGPVIVPSIGVEGAL